MRIRFDAKYIPFIAFLYLIYSVYCQSEDTATYKITYIAYLFFFIAVIFIYKIRYLYIRKEIIWQISYILFGTTGFLVAANTSRVFSVLMTLSLLCVFLIICVNFFCDFDNGIEMLEYALLIVSFAYSLRIIAVHGISGFLSLMAQGERISDISTTSNPNTIGYFTSIGFNIALTFFIQKKKTWTMIPGIVCFLVAIGTGSRKVMVILILGVLFNGVYLGNTKDSKKRIQNLLKGIIVTAVGLFFLYNTLSLSIFHGMAERVQDMLKVFGGDASADGSTILRMKLLKAGWSQFLKTPFWGVGLDNSYLVAKEITGHATYLHNNYIEILVNTGMVGFLIYYSFYAYLFFAHLKILKKNYNIDVLLSFMLLCCELFMQIGYVSYYVKQTYILMALWIVVLWSNRDKKGKAEEMERNE